MKKMDKMNGMIDETNGMDEMIGGQDEDGLFEVDETSWID